MAVVVYGLASCDTCRKALKWLKDEGIAHRFVDFRKDGVEAADVAAWLAAAGRERLINRRGTTYRSLTPEEKTVADGPDPLPLLIEKPALMKRPVFSAGGAFLVGFGEAEKAALKNFAS